MNPSKRKRLERSGWRVGSVRDFLNLSPADAAFIELKLRLAQTLAARRAREQLTQVQAARLLGSSQSRVAKMEAGDPSVSVDLLIRSLLALGASTRELASAFVSRSGRVARSAVGRRPARGRRGASNAER